MAGMGARPVRGLPFRRPGHGGQRYNEERRGRPRHAEANHREIRGKPMNTYRRSVLMGGVAALAGHGVHAEDTPKKGGVLKVSAPTNPSSLDPATGGSGQDHAFLYPIFDTLVDFDFPTLKAI